MGGRGLGVRLAVNHLYYLLDFVLRNIVRHAPHFWYKKPGCGAIYLMKSSHSGVYPSIHPSIETDGWMDRWTFCISASPVG